MTDPTSHDSPSERDDDREGASRDSYPPETNETVSALDLDAIEQWARGSTIVAARAHIPALVRELRESRAELSRLRADIAARDQLAAEVMAHFEGVTDEPEATVPSAQRDPDPTALSGPPAWRATARRPDGTTLRIVARIVGDRAIVDHDGVCVESPWLAENGDAGACLAALARWCAAEGAEMVSAQSEPVGRSPDPTVPGSPGERVTRLG